MNSSEDSAKLQFPCRYLRNKEMYYETVEQDNDPCASGIYWCTKTHEGFGPDGKSVCKSDCCATRSCYVG